MREPEALRPFNHSIWAMLSPITRVSYIDTILACAEKAGDDNMPPARPACFLCKRWQHGCWPCELRAYFARLKRLDKRTFWRAQAARAQRRGVRLPYERGLRRALTPTVAQPLPLAA